MDRVRVERIADVRCVRRRSVDKPCRTDRQIEAGSPNAGILCSGVKAAGIFEDQGAGFELEAAHRAADAVQNRPFGESDNVRRYVVKGKAGRPLGNPRGDRTDNVLVRHWKNAGAAPGTTAPDPVSQTSGLSLNTSIRFREKNSSLCSGLMSGNSFR